MNSREFRKAQHHIEVTVGESVRIIRELQGFSQNDDRFIVRLWKDGPAE